MFHYYFVLVAFLILDPSIIVQAAVPNAKLNILNQDDDTITSMLITMTNSFGYQPPNDETFQGLLRKPTEEMDPYFCNATITTTTTIYTKNDILLIPRGECTFELKALVAQTHGAGGIIIYNTLESRYGWKGEEDEDEGGSNENDTSSIQTESSNMLYPHSKHDYDCGDAHGGIAHVDSLQMESLDPPKYTTALHDSYMILDDPKNLCTLPYPNKCESQRCVLTGPPTILNNEEKQNNNDGFQYYQACCAWDIILHMRGDSTIPDEQTENIVAMFVTMNQGDVLQEYTGSSINVTLRSTPRINAASIILWMIGTSVVLFSAVWSAKDYKWAKRHMEQHFAGLQQQQQPQQQSNGTTSTATNGDDTVPLSSPRRNNNETTPLEISNEQQQSQQQQQQQQQQHAENDGIVVHCDENGGEEEDGIQLTNRVTSSPVQDQYETTSNGPTSASETIPNADNNSTELPGASTTATTTNTTTNPNGATTTTVAGSPTEVPTLDLTVWHALGFVVFASAMLLLLFYFKFYDFITVMYGLACCSGSTKLIFIPLYSTLAKYMCNCTQTQFYKSMFPPNTTLWFGLHELSWGVLISMASGLAWGITWLYVGFTTYRPSSTVPFYWISQNIFGAIVCIDFLSIIRLNSIKVATALLVVAFVYDIFFVFLTPLFMKDGESVMIEVATGGGGLSGGDEEYCEKYPNDSKCWGGEILPLVFTIPRINDYRGGSSLLGLGDIILPGLLIAFCARLDAAKQLSSMVGLDVRNVPRTWYQGYLLPLIIAYGIGLLGASIAVYLMERGQPALLYIIPATLGVVVIIGRYQYHELGSLWHGPQEIQWADNLVRYSRTLSSSNYQVYYDRAMQMMTPTSTTANTNQSTTIASTTAEQAPLSIDVEMSALATTTTLDTNDEETVQTHPIT